MSGAVVVLAVASGAARWLTHIPAWPAQVHPAVTIKGFWSPQQMANLQALVEGLEVYPVTADDMTSVVKHVSATIGGVFFFFCCFTCALVCHAANLAPATLAHIPPERFQAPL